MDDRGLDLALLRVACERRSRDGRRILYGAVAEDFFQAAARCVKIMVARRRQDCFVSCVTLVDGNAIITSDFHRPQSFIIDNKLPDLHAINRLELSLMPSTGS